MEQVSDIDTKYSWCVFNGPLTFGKGTGKIENQKKKRDHPDYSIVENDQNTEKSPGPWWDLSLRLQ